MNVGRYCRWVLVLALGMGGAQASHDWGGIDVCTAYRDTAPPGFDPQALPEPHSAGAQVLQRYCVQCHELPGPGRHTAEEWPAVVERMVTLMDVSRRFRGLMGRIDIPDVRERRALEAYLVEHALIPAQEVPAGRGAAEFSTLCAGCHALPDPRQHQTDEWPRVVARMARNARVMGRDWNAETAARVLTFLQAGERSYGIEPHGHRSLPAPADWQPSREDGISLAPLLWLLPFFLLAALGAARWWHASRRRMGGPWR